MASGGDISFTLDAAVLQSSLEDLRPALIEISVHLLSKSQEAFQKQGYGRRPENRWRPRSVPNVAGIIGDLNRNMNPPQRRWEDRPALVDTGRLRQSINWAITDTEAIVGTNVQYAEIHQVGGRSKVRLTRTGKDGLFKLLGETYTDEFVSAGTRQLREDLGWLLKKRSPNVTVHVPRRPFVGFDDEDEAEVNDIIADHMRGRL